MHKVRTGADDVHAAVVRRAAGSTHRSPSSRSRRAESAPRPPTISIHDELNLDGNPALNLASFVTTWMEPRAQQLATETLNRNFVDQDEYPQTEEIHHRVVSMIGRLFNAPAEESRSARRRSAPRRRSCSACSRTSGPGASAARRRQRQAQPRLRRRRPHLLGEVRALLRRRAAGVPLTADRHIIGRRRSGGADRREHDRGRGAPRHHLHRPDRRDRRDQRAAAQAQDGERLGHPDPRRRRQRRLHRALFYPELKWDFRLEQVRSINVSNHKFGLVYPGMGSVLFRDLSVRPRRARLPDQLPRRRDGRTTASTSPAPSNAVLQYYNFLRLGRDGYARIVGNLMVTTPAARGGADRVGRVRGCSTTRRFLPVVVVRPTDKDPAASTSSSSPSGCASAAGSSPPTRCRRTPSRWRCCGWSSRRTSAATWRRCCSTT